MIRRKFMVPVSATHILSTIFFFLCSVLHCSARDTITPEDWLSNDGGTLVSAGKTFELGFFNPDGSSKIGRFVGIWDYRSKPRRVVWVANRKKPLPLSDTPSGVLPLKKMVSSRYWPKLMEQFIGLLILKHLHLKTGW